MRTPRSAGQAHASPYRTDSQADSAGSIPITRFVTRFVLTRNTDWGSFIQPGLEFASVHLRPYGTLAAGVTASSPGDAITFIAHRGRVIIVTGCSVGYLPLNQGHCSPLRIEISPATAP
jgi:hypothetical protein